MTYAQARAELFNLKGVNEDGTGRRQWGSFSRPNITAGGQARGRSGRPGFYDTTYGVAPTEAEIQAYWKANGGGGRRNGRRTSPPAVGSEFEQLLATARNKLASPSTPVAEKSMYEQLLLEAAGDVKAKTAEANQANLDRYKEEKGLRQGVYDRSMSELDNWGGVQTQLNAETAQQNLDQINANLVDRGLGNSTNLMAAKLQSDRNLALQQQDVSERKSDRKVQYDRTLTGDVADVIRSRYDNAPDPNQLMSIYAKLGEAEAMDKARTDAARLESGRRRERATMADRQASLLERIAQIQAGAGPNNQKRNGIQAGMMANSIAGRFMGGILGSPTPGQVGGAMAAGNVPSMRPSWTSNAFPHLPGESRDEAFFRRVYG